MRPCSPDSLPLLAGVLSVLLLAVPVPSRADPAASPPRASDTNPDSQTIQREIQQHYRKRSKKDVIDGNDRDPSAGDSPRSAVSTGEE